MAQAMRVVIKATNIFPKVSRVEETNVMASARTRFTGLRYRVTALQLAEQKPPPQAAIQQ